MEEFRSLYECTCTDTIDAIRLRYHDTECNKEFSDGDSYNVSLIIRTVYILFSIMTGS